MGSGAFPRCEGLRRILDGLPAGFPAASTGIPSWQRSMRTTSAISEQCDALRPMAIQLSSTAWSIVVSVLRPSDPGARALRAACPRRYPLISSPYGIVWRPAILPSPLCSHRLRRPLSPSEDTDETSREVRMTLPPIRTDRPMRMLPSLSDPVFRPAIEPSHPHRQPDKPDRDPPRWPSPPGSGARRRRIPG